MKSSGKMVALLGMALAAATSTQSQGNTYQITRTPQMEGGTYFVGNTGGFNMGFKSPNQRQKRKYCRINPNNRKRYGLKRK